MGKSWKTTLAGLITGLMALVPSLVDMYREGAFDGKDLTGVALGVGVMVIGRLAKDHDVTGGPAAVESTESKVESIESKVESQDLHTPLPGGYEELLLKILRDAANAPTVAVVKKSEAAPSAVESTESKVESIGGAKEPGI